MVATRLASQATTLKTFRAPNTIVWVGTSRIAVQYQDTPIKRIKSNNGWMNWAAGWLRGMGKPLVTLDNLATSGYRTDQFAPAVTAAIALAPSNICLDGPVNDFAASYPAAGTTVATAYANMTAYFKAINDAGIRVIYVWERGANSFTSAQIGYLNDFNRLMANFIQNGDGDGRGPPNVIVLDPTAKSVVTSNTTAVALKNSADGTHDNVAAAKILGLEFANKLAPYLREIPGHRLRSLTHSKSGLGARSMLNNAGMSGTVAATGTGNTGSVPTNYTTNQSGGVTCVYSIEDTVADADGNTWGKQVKMVATATASGYCSLILSLDRTNIVAGDLIKTGCEIDVAAAATNLQGVYQNTEWFPTTGGTTPMIDMSASTIGNDTGDYVSFPTEPDPLLIAPFTGSPFTNLLVRLVFGGAGSATVIYRKPWAERS